MSPPRATLARRRSERLARRALGCALDADLTDVAAASLLVDVSDRELTVLQLARSRVREAAVECATSRRAIDILSIAVAAVEAERVRPEERIPRPAPQHLEHVAGPCVVLVGPPGAGKGTQGQHLAVHFDVAHFSTGELMRAAAEQESLIGFQARVFMDSGRLVPDHVVLDVLAERLATVGGQTRGFILDGVPRTLGQARSLEELLGARPIDVVIELVVCEATSLTRLQHRGRDDDSPAALRRRYADYSAVTRPMTAWYRHRHPVWRIDGERPAAEITAELIHRLQAHRASRQDLAR